jgi:hypothetical protein
MKNPCPLAEMEALALANRGTAETKRKPGRPRTRLEDHPGAHVGFRSSRALKDRLTAAAEQSRRSLSAEVQFRLEQSFRDEDLADRIVARLTTVLAPKPPET